MNSSRLFFYSKRALKRIFVFFAMLYVYGLITIILYDSTRYLFEGWIFYLDKEYISRIFTLPLLLIFIFLLFIFQYLNVLYFIILSSARYLTKKKFVFYFTAGSLFLFFVTKVIVFVWKEELIFYEVLAFSIDFTKQETQAFWFGIVFPYLLFYSLLLPLWYYRLGDWFWNRGKYAKMD